MERENLSLFNSPDNLPVRFFPSAVRHCLVYYTDNIFRKDADHLHPLRIPSPDHHFTFRRGMD